MHYRVLFIIALLLNCLCADAVPAYPKKIPITVDGQTVYIRLFGDEFNKRAETTDGYTLLNNGKEWFYAEKDAEGYLKASKFKLTAQRDRAVNEFLKGIPQHLERDQKESSRARAIRAQRQAHSGTRSAVGKRKVLIILMQYTDLAFVKSQEDFDHLFNLAGYSEDGAAGSVYDFYTDVSYGQLNLKCDVIGPFKSAYNRAHYGKNDRDGDDQDPYSLFFEAMEYASQMVHLKDYDSNGDGYIDNVHIVFAGHGEEAGASSDAIWSHECTFSDFYEYQGMKVDRYSCAPELRGKSGEGISRIGPHCHEIGHALGAMDFYDTNYDKGGKFEGTGDWDVMASGSWNEDGVVPPDFNPYVKMYDYGWVQIPEMPDGEVTIPSSSADSVYYRLTNTADDYYLVENRTKDKWGRGVPGSGLLIFHIHPNVASSGNQINASYPQKCYPVCASSTYATPNNNPNSYGKVSSDGCPYPGSSKNTSFSSSTKPAAFSWDGSYSNVSLMDITQNSDGTISLINHSSASDIATGPILYQEGFEAVGGGKYQVTVGEGSSKWGVYTFDPGSIKTGGIVPHSGSKCLRFAPQKLSSGNQESHLILKSNIAEEAGRSILTFYYSAYNYRPEEGIFYIMYKYDDVQHPDTTWIQSPLSGWNSFMLDLPVATSYEIDICGRGTFGQSISLDDIEVRQISTDPDTAIEGLRQDWESEEPMEIYDLFGRKRTQLQKGLNIVKYKDRTKKVFISQ